jgi:hypothetical protein
VALRANAIKSKRAAAGHHGLPLQVPQAGAAVFFSAQLDTAFQIALFTASPHLRQTLPPITYQRTIADKHIEII